LRKVLDSKVVGTQMINGQEVPVVQPEVYVRNYCKSCNNEIDSGDIKKCPKCDKAMSQDVHIKVIELPLTGSESGQ
tara:strand:- start:1462 stop:1689 length:228 start_codon:yes stop_codon:yes gene_type:complete